MRAEDPIQFGIERIATIFRDEVAPAILVIEPEPEELAEIIGEVRSDAVTLQAGIEESIGLVPAYSSVFPAVELPLTEEGQTCRLAGPRLETLDFGRDFGRLRPFPVTPPRENQFAAQQKRFPFSLAQRLPAIQEIEPVKVSLPNVVS